MDKKKDNGRCFGKRLFLIYLAILSVMAVMVAVNLLGKSRPAAEFGLRSFRSISSCWADEQGYGFDWKQIDSYAVEGKDYISAYYRIPERQTNEDTIVFRSKNTYVTALLDGEEIYRTDMVEAPFYNHSPGTRWNLLSVSCEDAGKTVELRIKRAYEDGRAKVDNIYMGDRAAIVLHLIWQKAPGLLICVMILVVGVLYLAASVISNWRHHQKNYSLMYLAIFALAAGIWCLLETNVLQLFSSNLRLIQVVDNMMLVVGAMPLFLYMDSIYGIFQSRLMRIVARVDMLYLILATISQAAGLWDYHQTLNGAIASYGVAVIILLVCVIREARRLKSEEEEEREQLLNNRFQQLGIWALAIALGGDLIRYLSMDVMDRAFIMRIGLLMFVIFFGARNIHQLNGLVLRGMRAELVSRLAYQDGLTDVMNRTAFMERIEQLCVTDFERTVGVLMFDINNLKTTNDTRGHAEGDLLICTCAEVLQRSFGGLGEIYRIGGDEFAVLITGEQIQERYEAAAEQFADILAEYDNSGRFSFPVSMAHGMALCVVTTKESILKAQEEADRRMYANKRQMKQSERRSL